MNRIIGTAGPALLLAMLAGCGRGEEGAAGRLDSGGDAGAIGQDQAALALAIGFDDAVSGAVIDNRYPGVTFKNALGGSVYAVALLEGGGNGVSIHPSDPTFAAEEGAVDVTFSTPQKTVSIDAKGIMALEYLPAKPQKVPFLQAFDASGNYLATQYYDVTRWVCPSGQTCAGPWQTLTITRSTADIARVRFSSQNNWAGLSCPGYGCPSRAYGGLYGEFDNLKFDNGPQGGTTPPRYQGCYVDDPTRALPAMLMSSGATYETCMAAATAQGFKYAGLQWYGQCFAGNALLYNRAYEADCNTPCSDNPAEKCGGAWRNSVYATSAAVPAPPSPPPDPRSLYQGCFTDTDTRALGDLLNESGVTVESCIDTAARRGYKYAGLQAGYQCFAGNSLGYARAPEGECNSPCEGNSGEICGGTWRNGIYVTPGSSPVQNGGFESQLSGWTTSGTVTASSTAHSGSFSAQVGGTSPTVGDSSISRTFTVPNVTPVATLSFWYNVHCPDTVAYDWVTATLKDNSTGTVYTVLPRSCANDNTWRPVAYALAGLAGRSVTLTLTSHDDNWATDPTYTQFDDVLVR